MQMRDGFAAWRRAVPSIGWSAPSSTLVEWRIGMCRDPAAVYGIDNGKNIFHVVGLSGDGRPVQKARFRRHSLRQVHSGSPGTIQHLVTGAHPAASITMALPEHGEPGELYVYGTDSDRADGRPGRTLRSPLQALGPFS